MESHNHAVLKIRALDWLYNVKQCTMVATEVLVGKYIFDVVGTDGKHVYIVEAKQDKSDFLRDCNRPEDIKESIVEYKKLLYSTGERDTYKNLIDKERQKSVKFFDESLYKSSHYRYIIAPSHLILKSEIPSSWGLVNEAPRQVVKCEYTPADKKFVQKMITIIAKKNTKIMLSSIGFDEDQGWKIPHTFLEE